MIFLILIPSWFSDIAPYLKEPFVLIAFVLMLLFSLIKFFLGRNYFSNISSSETRKLFNKIVSWIMALILIVILLSFAWKFIGQFNNTNCVYNFSIRFVDHDNKPLDINEKAIVFFDLGGTSNPFVSNIDNLTNRANFILTNCDHIKLLENSKKITVRLSNEFSNSGYELASNGEIFIERDSLYLMTLKRSINKKPTETVYNKTISEVTTISLNGDSKGELRKKLITIYAINVNDEAKYKIKFSASNRIEKSTTQGLYYYRGGFLQLYKNNVLCKEYRSAVIDPLKPADKILIERHLRQRIDSFILQNLPLVIKDVKKCIDM